MGDIVKNLKEMGPTIAIVLAVAIKFGFVEAGPAAPEMLKPAPAKPAV